MMGSPSSTNSRWNVASLYVLYCPTLIIFVSCCSFVQFDVPSPPFTARFFGVAELEYLKVPSGKRLQFANLGPVEIVSFPINSDFP